MPSLNARLRLLKSCRLEAAGAILAEALPHAEPMEREILCRAAVGTGRTSALAAVLRSLHTLGPAGVELAAGADVSLEKAIDAVLVRSDGQATLNVIDVLARRADASLAGRLVDLLGREDGAVSERAAAALLDMTVALCGPTGRRRCDLTAARRMDEAVTAAARAYRAHRRKSVLLAAALLAARPGPALAGLLKDEDQSIAGALRGVVDRTGEPLVRRNLVRWMGAGALGRSAARRLHKLQGLDDWADALVDGHLLLAPARVKALKQADHPLRCLPAPADAAALPRPVQASVPRLAGRVNLTAARRLHLLADMIALPSPVARYRALAILSAQGVGRVAEAVEPFLFDPDLAVARVAVQWAFSAPQRPDHAKLAWLERAGHRPIARRVTSMLARSSGERFFRRWREMPRPHRCAAALAALKCDRQRFIQYLGRLMMAGGPKERREAVTLARRLRLIPPLEERLLLLAAGDDPHLASAALSALADGRSPQRAAVLTAALNHDDGRVRANAVESLVRIGGRSSLRHIGPLAGDAHNRVRANAVRALLRLGDGDAPAALRRMLDDERPLHRVSGIWAARAARAAGAAGDLMRLAECERRPELRTRALAALRMLDGCGDPMISQKASIEA